MSRATVLVDSNILIYSESPSSPFFTQALGFLNELVAKVKPALTIQNLVEFYSVMTNSQTMTTRPGMEAVLEKMRRFVNSGLYTHQTQVCKFKLGTS